ncbi:MAG: uracil-DNA glycosylase [Gallionella sp.]
MDRDEAILRELNLYPQWTLRATPEQPVGDVVAVMTAEKPAVAVAQSDEQVPLQDHPVAEMEHAYAAYAAMEAARDEERLPYVDEPASFQVAKTWSELKQQVRDCQRCDLRAGCKQTVLGVGDEQADWMFIGEAPGAEEDERGEPFVGEAGKLLDNMLAAIKLQRGKQVYIANVVKCRPPEKHNPSTEQAQQCLPYLARQIELIQPKVIVALGKVAALNLLGEEGALDELRGVLHDYHGIPVVVSYHPAYLLRRPTAKAQAWQDLCFAVDVMQQA